MRIQQLLFLSIVASLLTGSALAQGSGTACDDPSPRFADSNPFAVPTALSGLITQIDEEGSLLRVTDEKNGEQWVFKVAKETRLRADKGLFEKKKIALSNLQVGQRARITFRTAIQGDTVRLGQGVVEIKVRKPKRS